jgi:hypothetical protein
MLGGTAPGANTELHDTVFAVGETIESTYEQLMGQWFGSLRGVHIDSWLPLETVDGHRVLLRADTPAPGEPKLWFINLGAYRRGRFGELHEVAFLVAATGDEAAARAKAALLTDTDEQHTDDLLAVEALPGGPQGGQGGGLLRVERQARAAGGGSGRERQGAFFRQAFRTQLAQYRG